MSYIRVRSVKFIRLQPHWKKHSAPSAEEYSLDAKAEKLLLAEVHTGCKSSIGVLNPNTRRMWRCGISSTFIISHQLVRKIEGALSEKIVITQHHQAATQGPQIRRLVNSHSNLLFIDFVTFA
jgi:hypothetical protein